MFYSTESLFEDQRAAIERALYHSMHTLEENVGVGKQIIASHQAAGETPPARLGRRIQELEESGEIIRNLLSQNLLPRPSKD